MLKGISLIIISIAILGWLFLPVRKNVIITCYEGGVETIDASAERYAYVLGAHVFETQIGNRFVVTGSCVVENVFTR